MPFSPHSLPITEAYISHLALTDVDGKNYTFNQAIHPATGPNGVNVSCSPLRLDAPGSFLVEQDHSGRRFHLMAGWTDGPHIDLELNDTRGKINEGADGWIRTGPGSADTTYYTSRPNMGAVGSLGGVGGGNLVVEGSMWMDHELWKSAEQLPFKGHGGMAGWDWFGINLHDGTAIELSPLR